MRRPKLVPWLSLASLQVVGQVGISFSIHLCVGQQLLEQSHGGGQVLVKTGEGNVCAAAARRYIEGAGHAIEFALHLFGRHVRRAQVFQILGGGTQRLVLIVTHIEEVNQLEQVVGSVLFVEHGHTLAGGQLRQVLAVIQFLASACSSFRKALAVSRFITIGVISGLAIFISLGSLP